LLAAIGAWRGRGLPRLLGIVLLICGLLLAFGRWNPLYFVLYSFVPGFDLFRTPARWMMLYTTGAAVLAGLGAQALLGARQWRHPSWILSLLLLTIVVAELLLAARALPQAEPTAPQAVYDLRSAPAHLATDPVRSQLHEAAAGRFLGMSTITYDPGDMTDYRRVFVDEPPSQLSEEVFADLTIAQKVQELLVPNLPLLWRIPAVDGYDGGLLPLQRYNLLASLLLPDSDTPSDGRLREQVRDMPSSALLGLFGSQYVLTDKVRDLWFEDVFYDRQIGMRLSPAAPSGAIEASSHFEATHLDLIAYVDGVDGEMPPVPDDDPLVFATVTLTDGTSAQTFELTVGAALGTMLADGGLDSAMANSSGAVVAYRDVENGHQEYRVRLPLSRPTTPTRIEATLLDPQFDLVVQAATLFDERTSMFQALLPSDRGDFRLVHSGDVKVYENRDVKPRASLAHQVSPAADAAQALKWLQSSGLDADTAVVEGDYALLGSAAAGDSAQITAYAPERVEVATRSADDALLVLSDAHYPGWEATVDGTPTQILYTNVLMRGVPVPAGDHTVIFTFEPGTWHTGLWIAAFFTAVWLLLLGLAWFKMQRRQPAAV
jgi:hypothetical protein